MSFTDSDVPDMLEFRKKVDRISDRRDRTLIQTLYLGAFRVSEVVTKATPYDLLHNESKGYGVHLSWKLDLFQEQKALLIKSAVAKRSAKELTYKIIALPTNPDFEPWTLDLLRLIKDRRGSNEALQFPLGRHRVRQILQERLGEHIFKKRSSGKRLLNPLRHYRITHLAEHYGFDGYDLCVYAGWSFKTGVSAVGQLDAYLHLGWRKYIRKLLKPLK